MTNNSNIEEACKAMNEMSKNEKHQAQKGGKSNWPTPSTAKALAAKELPELLWLVEDLLCEGLTILCGRPKCGKSWLVLMLSISIAKGEKLIEDFQANISDVLYLALEDNERRLKKRLLALYEVEDIPENMEIQFKAPRLDEGLVAELEAYLGSHPKCKFIVIDTLGRITPPKKSSGDNYNQVTAELSQLHDLALNRGISLLLVHHTRKGSGESDPIEDVLGSTALTGVADTTWVVFRSQNQSNGKFMITGRDGADLALPVSFHNGVWGKYDPDRKELSDTERKIIEILQARNEPLKPKEISAHAEINYDAIRKALGRMTQKKNPPIKKLGNGFYMAVTVSQNAEKQDIPSFYSVTNALPNSDITESQVTDDEFFPSGFDSVTVEYAVPEELWHAFVTSDTSDTDYDDDEALLYAC